MTRMRSGSSRSNTNACAADAPRAMAAKFSLTGGSGTTMWRAVIATSCTMPFGYGEAPICTLTSRPAASMCQTHELVGEAADVPEVTGGVDLRMGRERHLLEALLPGHRAARREVVRVERECRAAFPQRQHAAGVLDRVGIGDVDRIGSLDRRVARDRRAEGRQQEAPGVVLGGELGRSHQAADVADAALGKGELLHHAVAVEPVPVALAGALEERRAVAIEAAAQSGRPAAGDGERRAAQIAVRRAAVVDALERHEQRQSGSGGVEGAALVGFGGAAERRPCRAGAGGAEQAQHATPVHRQGLGHRGLLVAAVTGKA